jgi:hypothetical protein
MNREKEDAVLEETSCQCVPAGNWTAMPQRAAAWLTPRVLVCPFCDGTLIELTAIRHRASRLPRAQFWRADTRRVMVRCSACEGLQLVYAYPLFNCIPPRRLATEMALLSGLVCLLVICSALPSQALLSLLP